MGYTIQVRRPKATTVGRTQSYRLGLRVSSAKLDPKVFVVVRDADGILDFDRIVYPAELRTLTVDASKPQFRTDTLDLYLAAQGLADNLLSCVLADLQVLLDAAGVDTGVIKLSGASR